MATDVSSFDLARMEALKEYAALEHQLCLLLKAAIKCEIEVAAAVLYNVSATRARYAILGSILRHRHPQTFYRAWPKVEKWLGPCDTARNHIVHWGEDEMHTIILNLKDRSKPATVTTRPVLKNNANRWNPPAKALIYNEAKIRAEARACRCMKHIVNRYFLSIHEPEQWPWTDIFQQPLTHQTAEEFLQVLNDRGHPAQL